MTDQPNIKEMVFAARNGQFGEFYNRLENDKSLAFVLLVLREHSRALMDNLTPVNEGDATTDQMSDSEAYEACCELFARGFVSMVEREDGSLVLRMTNPEEAAAAGRAIMTNTPTIN